MAIYHPKNKVGNDFYIEHFKKTQGVDLTNFLVNICGRNTRYIIENKEENSVTMAIEASKRVLKKANMHAEELDMIIFASPKCQNLVFQQMRLSYTMRLAPVEKQVFLILMQTAQA